MTQTLECSLPMPAGRDRVRVRYAPNGEVGFAAFFTRTILYSWLFARRYGGDFVLRWDDTDLDHQIPGALEEQAEGMRWLGLTWDEGPDVGGSHGPYRQSERRDRYEAAAGRLLAEGAAYPCYCSLERLEEVAAQARRSGSEHGAYDGRCRDLSPEEVAAHERAGRVPAIRFRVPEDRVITCTDLLRGDVRVHTSEIRDFVVRRPDGWPNYHLTVTVDDHDMGISHVLRGAEGLSNMAPQALVHEALGLTPPLYLHFPLVMTEGLSMGERFLPRGRLLYVDELRAAGYPPEVVVSYYASIGYGGASTEIRTLDELARDFDFRKVSRKNFVHQSQDKLAWTHRTYWLRHASDEAVTAHVAARLAATSPHADEHRALAARAVEPMRTRIGSGEDPAEVLAFAVRPFAPAPVPPGRRLALETLLDALEAGRPLEESLRALAPTRDERAVLVPALLGAVGAADSTLAVLDVVRILTTEEVVRRGRASLRTVLDHDLGRVR